MGSLTRRKISYILMGVSSSLIWYYFLVDTMCDTPYSSICYALAQFLVIALPFICCLVWDISPRRTVFVIVYFIVLAICDYLHNLLYNILWDIDVALNLSLDILKIKLILTAFMVLVRIFVSIYLLRWSYSNSLVILKFNS